MRALVVMLAACAAAPHNYAEGFVAAVTPEAERLPMGSDAVIAREGTQLLVCIADVKHHTECHLIADWTPKPPTEAKP